MKKEAFIWLCLTIFIGNAVFAQSQFNGIESNMSNIYRLSDAQTRSII